MNGTINFFESDCPFTFTGWELQKQGGESTAKDYVNELGKSGDEIRRAAVNPKTATSWEFILAESVSVGSDIIIPDIGQVLAAWHLDQLQVRWDRGAIAPKMTVSAHKHDAGAVNPHAGARTYKSTIAVKAVAFGVPADFGALKLAEGAVVDFRDVTYTLSLSHIDETGRSGNELKGDNHDGVETLVANFTGARADGDVVVEEGWTPTEFGKTPSNTGVTTSSFNIVKHLQHEAA